MILAFLTKPSDPREQDVKPEPPIDYTIETPETIAHAKASAKQEREEAIEQIIGRERMKDDDKLLLCDIVERQGIGAVRQWLDIRERMHK